MDLPTRIYLTGFMGSGKSTVGPILANVLGYVFLDLDEAIEREAGVSIPELFARDGEAAFRRLETDVLRKAGGIDRVVVALGGGAVVREETLSFVLERGTLIYLRTTPAQLTRRLVKGRADRPLLQDEQGKPLPRERLRARIEAMLEARTPYYERAHLTVDAGGRSIGKTVDTIVKALRSRDSLR